MLTTSYPNSVSNFSTWSRLPSRWWLTHFSLLEYGSSPSKSVTQPSTNGHSAGAGHGQYGLFSSLGFDVSTVPTSWFTTLLMIGPGIVTSVMHLGWILK